MVNNELNTGLKASVLPRTEGVPLPQLNQYLGIKFSGVTSQSRIKSRLLKLGNGTRAIDYGERGDMDNNYQRLGNLREV